jgi:5-methylcytosine-specific restriction endonuclease McrA
MNNCKHCGTETTNPKFCSNSCSAKHNNNGVRRHGKPAGNCVVCGKPKANSRAKYCSIACLSSTRKIHRTDEEKRAINAARQAQYRAKHGYLRAYALNANRQKIQEIYANCPEGYEVDHIIPLAKGGLHHEDNLQYLTPLENKRKGAKLLFGTGGEIRTR